MIEGEIVGRIIVAAILAGEAVSQEHVEPGEGGAFGDRDVLLEGDHRRQIERPARRTHLAVILGQYIDPIEEHRLDGVVPRP